MDLERLGRILWARRLIVLLATLSCFLGGVLGDRLSPKQYEGSARIDLQIVKPDPLTGFVVTSKNLNAYVDSQVRLIRDYQVAVRVAEALGWLDSPDLQTAYAGLKNNNNLDYNHWVAQRISGSTSAGMVEDSNIIEIRYRAGTPELAKLIANALRSAYIEATLDSQRQASAASAIFEAEQAEKSKAKLAALDLEKSTLERQTGVVLGDNGTDLEGRRLHTLAASTRTAGKVRVQGVSSAAIRLAQLDDALASQEKVLGPKHPGLNALRQRRGPLAAQVAQEQAVVAQNNNARLGNDRAMAGRLGEQMEKVISQREMVTRLRLIQDEINMNRERYNEAAQRVVELQQAANLNSNAFTAVGLAESSDELIARRRPLSLLGSAGLGLATGVLLSLLAELLARRVRSEKDLQLALPTSTYLVLPQIGPKRRPRSRLQVRRSNPARARRWKFLWT